MSAPEQERVLFGPYRLEELLGRGGMGEVYRAYDTVHDRVVALKRLSGTLDGVERARFRREAKLVASLRAEHIVDVYDYGDIDGHPYLAMRLVEGTDLHKLLDDGRLDPARTVEILSQVARALDAAHAGGVVHRDIKPANILIDGDGDAFLADFGIARPLAPDATRLTETGAAIGTLDYMAPERLLRQEIDPRSDVYALACVLFQCLTGTVPFPGDDPAGKVAAQLNDPPPSPSLFDRRIPPALDLIVATGMAKDPGSRYPTAGELMSAAASAGRQDGATAGSLPTTPELADDPGQGALLRAIISVAARAQDGATTVRAGNQQDDCPYPGLRSFEARDAGRFYGREQALTDVLVSLSRQTEGSGPLVVVGASGAGKSSLLRAGVLPLLDSSEARWPQVITSPGHDPLGALAARLAPLARADAGELAHWLRTRPADFGKLCRQIAHQHGGEHSRLVIAVDQFEELFTSEPARRQAGAFAVALASAWPALVVLTVRADFMEPCIRLDPLKPAFANPFLLGPLGVAELSRVITEPARAAGLRIEDGLTDRLITDLGARDDTGYDPGSLPRLAHALRQTWQNGSGEELTLRAYQATGGIDRAVALTADGVYNRLGDADKYFLRQGLLRMVTVLDGDRITRRKARHDEIAPHVLRHLVDARLVTAESDGVRLSHDALLIAWPRLREWIEQDRQALVIRQQLGQAAMAWQASGGDQGELYRGARLAAALEWAHGRTDLSHTEQRFLRESKRAQQRATRRLRGLVAGLAVFLVAALVAGGLAVIAQNNAEDAAAVATSRQLAVESLSEAEFDPVTAQRKALQAWRTSPTPQARGALISAATRQAPAAMSSGLGGGLASDISDDGRFVAVGSPAGEIAVLDTRTGKPIDVAFERSEELIAEVAFSPDGTMLATASFGSKAVKIWDIPSGTLVRSLQGYGAVAWSSDGQRVLSFDSGIRDKTAVAVWHARTGQFLRWLNRPEKVDNRSAPVHLAYSPDGTRVAVSKTDGVVELWDAVTSKLIKRDTTHRDETPDGMPASQADVALSDDVYASSSVADNAIRLYDARTGEKTGAIKDPYFSRSRGRNPDMAFTPDGAHLVSPDRRAGAVLWNVRTRQRVGEYAKGPTRTGAYGAAIMSVAVSPGGDAVGVQADGTVVRWRANPNWYNTPGAPLDNVTFVPGRNRASATDTRATYEWNPDTGEQAREPKRVRRSFDVTYAPDGSTFTGLADGTIAVTDRSGREVRTLKLPAPNIYRGDIAVTPDGSTVGILAERPRAGGGFQTNMTILDAATLRERSTVDLGNSTVSGLAFAPDSRTLAIVTNAVRDEDRPGVSEAAIRRWRLPDLAEQRPIPVDKTGNLEYTPDGRSLVLAAAYSIQVRDAGSGELRREFGQHASDIRALAVSPDGKTVATGTVADPAVRLWDIASGRPIATLTGHDDYVVDLEFAPDGRRLASASADTDVGLWPVNPDDAASRVCEDLAGAGQRGRTELGC